MSHKCPPGFKLVLALVAVSPTAVTGSGTLESLGRWPGHPRGAVSGIHAADGRAYLNLEWGGVLIVDVSQPALPVPLGAVDVPGSGTANGFDISGDWLLLPFGRSLGIANVSDPRRPVIVSQYQAEGVGGRSIAMSVKATGNLAYLAHGEGGLLILDIGSPTAPSLAGHVPSAGAMFTDVELRDGLAYVATEVGLTILDLANPTAPSVLGGFGASLGQLGMVRTGEGRAHVFGGATFSTVDVQNPRRPFRDTWHAVFRGSPVDVREQGGLAYFATAWDGLVVMDFSQPFASSEVGALPVTGYGRCLDLLGDRAYLGTSQGLEIADVRAPAQPVRLGGLRTDGFAADVKSRGALAYLADESGLRILDLTDAASPVLAGASATRGRARAVRLMGNRAYVASGWGLEILEVTAPSNPSPAGDLNLPALERLDVSPDGERVVASDLSQVSILDTSNPELPVFRGAFRPQGSPGDVALDGNLVYVADSVEGVVILDIADPDRPVAVGEIPIPSGASSLALDGDRLLVGSGRTLRIFDVAERRTPKPLGTLAVERDWVLGVTVIGNRAWLATGDGVLVVDVSDPMVPRLVATHDSRGFTRATAAMGSLLLLADGEWGLEVLREPERQRLRIVEAASDHVELEVPRAPEASVVLEASDTLRDWSGVLTNAPGTGGVPWTDRGLPASAQRYFRLRP